MSVAAGWLNPAIDWPSYRQELALRGRVQVRDVFRPELAERFAQCLRNEVPWGIAYRQHDANKLISAEQWRAMPLSERNALHQQVCAEAGERFQFWYQSYMMVAAYLDQRAPGHFFNQVVEWMNADEFLSLGRSLSGMADIRKADAQATCYTPGCFLTSHDDSGVPQGQIRRLAYVLSFTESWRAEWGGLLHFTNADGEVVETLMPRFNTLNVFLTPQAHEVSYVTPFANLPRLSITGWFRAD